jgi:hypothetical protein
MSAEQSGPFGGLSASEAGRKSWEKRRERQAAEAAESELPTGSDAKIERALREKAERGDVAASRVLSDLGILSVTPERAHDQRLLALLTPEQRACIEAALLERGASHG